MAVVYGLALGISNCLANLSSLGFYINLPCGGVAAILLIFITLPHRTTKNTKETILETLSSLDLFGFAMFAPAAIQFLLALQWGGAKYPWNNSTVVGLFCGSFGTLLAFLAWEYRVGEQAMIPLSIISRRVIWSSCINNGCLMGSMIVVSYYLPLYFQAVRHATPALSGVYLLPLIISTILCVIITGALSMYQIPYKNHFPSLFADDIQPGEWVIIFRLPC